MNGTQVHAATAQPGAETRARVSSSGSLFEAFGAIATVALAIVGLAGIWPPIMAAIATIVVGAATLMEGGALRMKTGQSPSFVGTEAATTEGITSVDVMGGLTAVVLGILALLGVASMSLVSVAVLVLGATYVFSGRIMAGLAAVVLGILAVCGVSASPLFLIGLLVLGATLLIGGWANPARHPGTPA